MRMLKRIRKITNSMLLAIACISAFLIVSVSAHAEEESYEQSGDGWSVSADGVMTIESNEDWSRLPTDLPRPTPRPTETPWPTPMPRPTASPAATAEPEQKTVDPMLFVFAGVLALVVAGIVVVAIRRFQSRKKRRSK